MSLFNKKIMRIGELTTRSTSQQRQYQHYEIIIQKKQNEKHTKKNTRYTRDRVQEQHKHPNCSKQRHNIQPINDKNQNTA